MRARRYASRLLLLALLAGCGGSGSSGFEPSFREGALIDQAIAEQRCVQGDGGLTICPSGALVPNPIGGLPNPFDVRVVAALDQPDGVDCKPGDSGDECLLTLQIDTEGLPTGAEVRTAVRLLPGGAWLIGPALEVQAASDGSAMLAPVTVDLAGADTADAVQVAVLVFGEAPASPTEEVSELAASGADYAFVLPPVPITPAGVP